MKLKIALSFLTALIIFIIYAETRDGHFHYERSGLIKAPPEKIFPYISQFKLGGQWSPYEKDIEMPKTFSDTDGQVGAWMKFGPSPSGSGRLEILELIPNQFVKLSLNMTAPFEAKNIVIYKLTTEAQGTIFTWSMEGEGNFIGKIMMALIDCEKMTGQQFDQGIENLKKLIETQNK